MPVQLWGFSVMPLQENNDPKEGPTNIPAQAAVGPQFFRYMRHQYHTDVPESANKLALPIDKHSIPFPLQETSSFVNGSPWTSHSVGNSTSGRSVGRIRQRTHMGAVGVTDSSSQMNVVTSVAGGTCDEEAQSTSTISSLPDLNEKRRFKSRRKGQVSNISHQRLLLLLKQFIADFPENLKGAWTWMKQNPRSTYLLILSVPFILRPSRLWKWRYLYFGRHANQGGEIGQWIERWAYMEKYRQVLDKDQKLLDSLGIVLPPAVPPDDRFRVLKLDTQAALKELVIRRERRAQTLALLEKLAIPTSFNCTGTQAPMLYQQAQQHGTRGEQDEVEAICSIPKVVFVPDGLISNWSPPRPGESKRYQQLMFDEHEMRQFLQDTRPRLVPLFDGIHEQDEANEPLNTLNRIHVWAVCVIYYFGGTFVGNYAQSESTLIQSLLWSTRNPIIDRQAGPAFLMTILGRSESKVKPHSIQMLAATPRHPALLCTLQRWEYEVQTELKKNKADRAHGIFGRSLATDLFPTFTDRDGRWMRGGMSKDQLLKIMEYEKQREADVAVDGTTRHGGSTVCHYNAQSMSTHTDTEHFIAYDRKMRYPAEVFVYRIRDDGEGRDEALVPHAASSAEVRVHVHEAEKPLVLPTQTEKVTLLSQLQHVRSVPGWSCMRCIKLPQYGQFERCKKYCPDGYTDLICRGMDMPEKKPVPLRVTVQLPEYNSFRSGKVIPRLIHQTWFEDVTLDRYPQLARLQNSWKNTGWKYRLYTDETARAYIEQHFPSRFVDAFDALIPGAYKADLFRYLVLMREGGVYADVDILLETNLEHLITPSMSFFAPRDVVAEFAGEPFCLWNGLIGAAPGHPFIVRAVERLVNLILERADVYDMERDLCRDKEGPLDVWKVWLQTLLLLSGPCALGVAVNEALGRSPLEKIETGWIGLDELEFGGKKDHGDALIMIVDKHDIGGFKMSDPERSLIVASTDMDGVEKNARESSNLMDAERHRQEQRKPGARAHYSEANKGVFVWGSTGIYADRMVTNERIFFNVQYVSTTIEPLN